MVRRVVVLGVAAGMILATAASVSVASSARSRPDVTAARSSATQTVASAGVKAAPPAASFTNEALWSSSDDWEPNVATAPNSSYVYEVTTRYSTKFCAKGQGHCMAFRSSADGGTTWSADSVICPCKVSSERSRDEGGDRRHNLRRAHERVCRRLSEVVRPRSDVVRADRLQGPLGAVVHGQAVDRDLPVGSGCLRRLQLDRLLRLGLAQLRRDASRRLCRPTAMRSTGSQRAELSRPNGNVYFSESAEQDAKSPTGPIKLAVVSSTNGGASWTTTFVDTSQQQPPCTATGVPGGLLRSPGRDRGRPGGHDHGRVRQEHDGRRADVAVRDHVDQ